MPQEPNKRSRPEASEEGLAKRAKLSNSHASKVPSEGRYQESSRKVSGANVEPVHGQSSSIPIYISDSDEDEELSTQNASATNIQDVAISQPIMPSAAAPVPSPPRAMTPVKPYDVCFGMVWYHLHSLLTVKLDLTNTSY